MPVMNFKAAVFDLDGTLIDSLGVWEKIDRDFLEKKRGIPLPDDYVDVIAPMTFAETAVYTRERFGLSETPQQLMDEWTEMSIYEYSNNIRLKSGVHEYLRRLKNDGVKIALCTSSPSFLYEPVLKNNGIYDYFDSFTGTCEIGKGKTEPDVYIFAAEKTGVPVHDCMAFEDVLEAARSAAAAKMAVCGVYDDRGRAYVDEMKKICSLYIRSFEELL